MGSSGPRSRSEVRIWGPDLGSQDLGSKNPDSGISGPPDFRDFRGFGPFLDHFWTISGPVLDDPVAGVRR